MIIHSLFILEEGGVCFYDRSYTDQLKNIKVDLITPFFSAIFTFSQKVVERKLEVLEMSDLRFVFTKERGFIFVIIAGSQENLLFIKSRLNKIMNLFFQQFDELFDESGYKFLGGKSFDNTIDALIYGHDEVLQVKSSGLMQKIIDYFNSLQIKEEIIGAALLTTKGTIIYSSVSDKLMIRIMKELEIRYLTGTFDVPLLFYTLLNGKKVCEVALSYRNLIQLLLIIEYPETMNLGMVDYQTEVIVEKLRSIF